MSEDSIKNKDLDRQFLLLALEEAKSRVGYTAPNPSVGAVVTRGKVVVACGKHWAAGHPHAEVEVLRQVESLEGCTVYVTLEPCCHFGKTPPCTDLLIERKVERVVFGFYDPNPRVAGKGEKLLREAGIEVVFLPDSEVTTFYQKYSWWFRTGKTWMTGKLALTIDEKTADPLNGPLSITAQEASVYTHLRRNAADVLITSQRTVANDNPSLNVRLGEEIIAKPVWIIDTHLNLPLEANLIKTAKSLTLVHGAQVDAQQKNMFSKSPFQLVEVGETSGKLQLTGLPELLARQGFHEAWIEVGRELFSYCVQNQIFNEIILYRSQKVMAPESPSRFDGQDTNLFQNYLQVSEEKIGNDMKETWFAREKSLT